jgi:hypothetical protein
LAQHRSILTVALGGPADTELLERLGAWRVLLTPWVPAVRTGVPHPRQGDPHGRGDAPPVVDRGRGAPAKPYGQANLGPAVAGDGGPAGPGRGGRRHAGARWPASMALRHGISACIRGAPVRCEHAIAAVRLRHGSRSPAPGCFLPPRSPRGSGGADWAPPVSRLVGTGRGG